MKRTRERKREREKWLDNVDEAVKLRKREKVEFGLKIERGISKMYIVDKR